MGITPDDSTLAFEGFSTCCLMVKALNHLVLRYLGLALEIDVIMRSGKLQSCQTPVCQLHHVTIASAAYMHWTARAMNKPTLCLVAEIETSETHPTYIAH